ncbi:MAG: hypothetical protein DRG39_03515 [Deltaproteobacteria bacterium]|nr:MAG: hypothetical protein DRG39_03515 [Deltaproteobacteria bacterium]
MTEKKRQKKRYSIELTRVSLFLWVGLFLLLIVWAFMLGIFVGKGLLPEKEFQPRKKDSIIHETREEREPEFSFHKRLTSPQPEAKKDKAMPRQKGVKKGGCYSVQIAAFLKEKDAQDMVKRLKRKRYEVYYTKKAINNKLYYRVKCGRFDNKRGAEMFRKRLLKQERLRGIIVRCR